MLSYSEKKTIAICSLLSAIVTTVLTSLFSFYERETAYSHDKAVFFRDTLDHLTDKDKAGLALLALWQLHSRQDERKTIVLAGVQTGNTDVIAALSALGSELKPYKSNLEIAARSSDTAIVESAETLLNAIDWKERVISHTDAIVEGEKNGDFSLGSASYGNLVEILSRVPEAQAHFTRNYTKEIEQSLILSNVLHDSVNDSKSLEIWLTNNISVAQSFSKNSHILVNIATHNTSGAIQVPEISSRVEAFAFNYIECFLDLDCEVRSETDMVAALFILTGQDSFSENDTMRLSKILSSPELKKIQKVNADIEEATAALSDKL